MTSIHDFRKMKEDGRKISMVTAYDFAMARIVDASEVDCVLVGDSCAMVMHGFPSTVHATTEMMVTHVAAVARGLSGKFLVADMPFLSFRKGPAAALECVDPLMKAGAHAVKLEGVRGHEATVEQIVRSGVPVMGHIGLTPQSIHQLGGFKVQGRDEETANELLAQAVLLEKLGCFSLVLECVPSTVAARITRELRIPTIGIGAGPDTDGQVLVLQDLLGMNGDFRPRFLRRFFDGDEQLRAALNRYHSEVTAGTFPSGNESYL
ncbi:MAG: 3-methyl-2-oxobutanoate hydroxymethyltransferase [Oligoflexia bacterium]|nr:3-methyl-2-oxobutanoate hydroxymethyltransferase [Oligoflexia bacterium]